MLKFVLSALLLSASATAFAEEGSTPTTGPVKLGDKKGTTVSWDNFAGVINGDVQPAIELPDTTTNKTWENYQAALGKQKVAQDSLDAQQIVVDAAQEVYDTENAKIQDLTDKMNQVEPKSAVPTWGDYDWFKTQQSTYNDVLDYARNEEGTEPDVYYYLSTGLSKVLYLSFTGQPATPANTDKSSWKNDKLTDFYKEVIEGSAKFSSVKVFLGFAEGSTPEAPKYNYTTGTGGYMNVDGYSSSDKEGIFDAIELAFESTAMKAASTTAQPTPTYLAAIQALDDQKAIVAQKLGTLNAAKKELDRLQKKLDAAKAVTEAALAAYNTASENYEAEVARLKSEALAYYQNVTLNGNVDATTPITASDYKGVIDGSGYVINVSVSGALFKKFTGQLSNAAVNGTFASSYVGAVFDKVAVNTGSAYRFYDDKGNVNTTTIESLAELGFAAREYFGVDFTATNPKLVALSKTTKVYNIIVNDLVGGAQKDTPYYINIGSENKLTASTGAEVTVPVNRFAQSATTDIASYGLSNVYYGPNNTCSNVEIADKDPFYAPVQITAEKLQYGRELKAGYNTVCLPFAVNAGLNENIEYVCTYDTEENGKFWFTSVAGAISANTPVLLIGKKDAEGFKLSLEDITIEPTPNSQMVNGPQSGTTQAFGTLKNCLPGEIMGQHNASKVYAYQSSSGTFNPLTKATTNIPSFRMVILTGIGVESGNENAPRRIGIRNEDGVEIEMGTSGVEDVVANEVSFNIEGGNGEIIFTSDVNYGKVEVYTLDGKVAAVANVIAGITTVNVQNGLYIVMGKKVLVK